MKDKKLLIILAVLIALAIIIAFVVVPLNNSRVANNTTTSKVEYSSESSDEASNDEDVQDIVLSESLSITKAGTYHLTGTIENGGITVKVGDDDKVKLILDNVSITNNNGPAIYVENADEVKIVLENGTTNSLTDNSADEDLDSCVYSRDDLELKGTGTLNIVSNSSSGIKGNDDLKITSGTYNITAKDDGVRANGLLQIDDGTINITAEEGLEATYVKINGGTLNITASDDGINAANKSEDYQITVEINGGDITINMGQGDTDGIDSNGNLYINGGTINITGNSPFDYDGEAKLNGGTIIVNGEETNTITNQFMGGGMQNPEDMQPGGMPGEMNQGGMQPGGMQKTR